MCVGNLAVIMVISISTRRPGGDGTVCVPGMTAERSAPKQVRESTKARIKRIEESPYGREVVGRGVISLAEL